MDLSRRQFLTHAVLTGTALSFPTVLRAQSGAGEIRVGLIGVNGRGHALAGELLKTKGARLAAVCDCDEAVLNRRADEYAKSGAQLTKFSDFRKLCESKEIDAVVIATPNHTHCLIAITAAANGKHVYVEKPVSHNLWEGRKLAEAQEKFKVVIQSGFQRRSEVAWHDAFAWLQQGELGKLVLARGVCYKPRQSIGSVGMPTSPPPSVDYDLWSGPRKPVPVPRKQFHYDWHWQFDWGNGDLGNQGPHQLDVCRWAMGDPELPTRVSSFGGRLGYQDDGDWANTQVLFLEGGMVPIIFEVRGLPQKGMDYKGGMDRFKGQDVGNVIEYEGGWLAGGHSAACRAFDKDGKELKAFSGGGSHMGNFIEAIVNGKQPAMRAAESGHRSSALAHLGNISWRLGKHASPEEISAATTTPAAAETWERVRAHLAANGVDLAKTPLTLGPTLTFDPAAEKFTGGLAEKANSLLKGEYREGFTLPNA
jgi:predicted dehydrogenase